VASTVSTTHLSFGLVSAPVKLKKVADKRGVAFKMCSPDGKPVVQRYIVEETGEMFAPAECEKAVENGNGELTLIGKETVKAIDEAANAEVDGIQIEKFIPLAEVPFERAEAAYFIAADKKAGLAERKPLALLRDGLKAHGVAGIGKLVLRSKQRAFVVYEKDGGLLLNTLVFADDFAQVAEAGESLEAVPETDAKTLTLFGALIADLEGDVLDLNGYADDSFEPKSELVAKALAGEKIEVPEKALEIPATEDNIEALLLASIGGSPENEAASAMLGKEPKPKAKPKAKAKTAA
jgi:DNA end-binding protein Ku